MPLPPDCPQHWNKLYAVLAADTGMLAFQGFLPERLPGREGGKGQGWRPWCQEARSSCTNSKLQEEEGRREKGPCPPCLRS